MMHFFAQHLCNNTPNRISNDRNDVMEGNLFVFDTSENPLGYTGLSLGDQAPLACFRSFHLIHFYIVYFKHECE